jgi:hypothetical protein
MKTFFAVSFLVWVAACGAPKSSDVPKVESSQAALNAGPCLCDCVCYQDFPPDGDACMDFEYACGGKTFAQCEQAAEANGYHCHVSCPLAGSAWIDPDGSWHDCANAFGRPVPCP